MALPTVLETADLHHPAVDAAMAAAAALLGMQAVYVGGLSGDEFVFARLWGVLPGAEEGQIRPRTDSMCHRLLAGAPAMTTDAGHDPSYADAPARVALDIVSYLGVTLAAPDGMSATFCAVDRRSVPASERDLTTVRHLARVVEAHLAPQVAPVVRRTAAGWRVAGTEEAELLSAMVLADLLASAPEGAGPRAAAPVSAAGLIPPPAPPPDADEAERLRHTVRQLEHALASRVTVEQAIGVLAERQRLQPRAAFERLRRAARSRGRRVVDLAREVVASTADPAVPLPPDLAGRR